MSPPSSTIILFFRLQATNVVWNKTSIHIQLFVKRNGEYFDVVIVLWDCCTHWGDQTVGVIINCCCHRLKYGAVIWVCAFVLKRPIMLLCFPDCELQSCVFTIVEVVKGKNTRGLRILSFWSKWYIKRKESRIEMISETKIRVNATCFIMLTVLPSSFSGSLPPFEN